MANPITGAFSATGQSATFKPSIRALAWGSFNVFLTGTGVASVQLERSYDKGSTWCGVYGGGVQLYVWSYTGTNLSEQAVETEQGVIYRLNCTGYTSGTVNYRLSQ